MRFRGFNSIGSVFFCLALVMFAVPRAAYSSTEWVYSAGDCASFSKGLRTYARTLGEQTIALPELRQEAREVISQACSAKFTHCGFSICQNSQLSSLLDAGQQESQVTAASVKQLAWFERPMSCSEYMDNIKTRFLPLGAYQYYSAKTKTEMDKAIDTSCSSRFLSCGFSWCSKVNKLAENTPPAKLHTAAVKFEDLPYQEKYKLLLAARKQRRRDFQEFRGMQLRKIAKKVKNEQKNNLSWKPFTIGQEFDPIEEAAPMAATKPSEPEETEIAANDSAEESDEYYQYDDLSPKRYRSRKRSRDARGTDESVSPEMPVEPDVVVGEEYANSRYEDHSRARMRRKRRLR